jgi:hypothetical protein
VDPKKWGQFGLFSKISTAMGWISCGVFRVENSEQSLLLCFPSAWYFIYQPLSLQKTKLFNIFERKIYLGLGYEFGLERIGI